MRKIVALVLILVFLSIPTVVLAHGLTLTLVEPGVLKAEYEGGGFSPRMTFTLYDADGEVVLEGPIDDNGEFHFDKSLEFEKAVVDDGMGHKASYVKGSEPRTEIPKIPVVIAVFAVVGIIFYVHNKKNKKKAHKKDS